MPQFLKQRRYPHLTLSSNDEIVGQDDVSDIATGCESDCGREGVGDVKAVRGALAHRGAEFNGAHDPGGCGLEVDMVEEILPSLLIPKCDLRSGGGE